MPYMEEWCVAGKTVEISRYYTYRFHKKGEKRKKKENPTSEAQKKGNDRRAERDLTRLMNANFSDGDYLVTMDYLPKFRPKDSREMQEHMKKFWRGLRKEFWKRGQELKYIHVMEVGKRGARHHHFLIPEIELSVIRELWPYGGIHVDPLHTDGQYRKIAAYFVKYWKRTIETEGGLMGKRWYSSRNLKRPVIIKRVISAGWFRHEAKVRKGYYLDAESVRSGVCEYNGYEYFSYTLIQQNVRKKKEPGRAGKEGKRDAL